MAGKSYRILILEYNPTDAEILEAQLHKVGLELTLKRVGSKEMFLKAVKDFKPDMILANYSIPKLDVVAALMQAQQDMPEVPWIVVSAAGTEDAAVACMKAGAADYVSKRNLTRLAPAVKLVLERKAAGSAAPPPSPAATPVAGPPEPAPQPATEPSGTTLNDLFRKMVEQTPDLLAFIAVDGKRLYNNPAYTAVLEDPDILQGTDSFLDIHPDDRDSVKRVFMDSLRTGTGRRIEYRLLDLRGETRYIESQGNVLRDPDGRVRCLAVVSRDVTERRRAEIGFHGLVAGTASVTGREFHTALVRHLATALGVRYALVSEVTASRDRVRALAFWEGGKWAKQFEYSVKDTPCEKVLMEGRMAYYPEHLQMLFPRYESLKTLGAVCYLGVPLHNHEGGVIGHIFVMDDKPLADYQRSQYVLGVFAARAAMEIERERASDRIRRSEASFRSILESLNDGVIMTDMDDKITYVNPRTTQLLGYAAAEMTGKLASSLLLPKEEWEALQLRNTQRQRGIAERYSTRLRKKDGTFLPVVLSAGPFRDQLGDIVGTIAVVSDLEPLPATPLT